jgi:hypothetical protein
MCFLDGINCLATRFAVLPEWSLAGYRPVEINQVQPVEIRTTIMATRKITLFGGRRFRPSPDTCAVHYSGPESRHGVPQGAWRWVKLDLGGPHTLADLNRWKTG